MLPLRYSGLWRAAGGLALFLIFAAALLPSDWLWQSDTGPSVPHSDKWLHALTFAALCTWFCGQYSPAGYMRVVFRLALFGIVIELCQALTNYRSADVLDFVADAAGIAAGLALARLGLGGWSLKVEDWYLQRRAGA